MRFLSHIAYQKMKKRLAILANPFFVYALILLLKSWSPPVLFPLQINEREFTDKFYKTHQLFLTTLPYFYTTLLAQLVLAKANGLALKINPIPFI